jgi:hypothetical protein
MKISFKEDSIESTYYLVRLSNQWYIYIKRDTGRSRSYDY